MQAFLQSVLFEKIMRGLRFFYLVGGHTFACSGVPATMIDRESYRLGALVAELEELFHSAKLSCLAILIASAQPYTETDLPDALPPFQSDTPSRHQRS